MDEVAAKLRISRRFLQTMIRSHPYYRLAGRKKLFTDEDVSRLIEAMPCPGNSSRPVPARRSTGTSGANISESLWTTARELLKGERQARSSIPGEDKPNVVSFPASSPPQR